MGELTDCTLIVPLWDGDPNFSAHLARMRSTSAAMQAAGAEVIFVNNGCDPGAIRTAALSGFVVDLPWNAGVAAAWNVGLAVSRRDILVYCNQDAVLELDPLRSLARLLTTRPDIAVVGVEGSLWDFSSVRHLSWVRPSRGQERFCDIVSGFLFALRREDLALVGGFDNNLNPCSYEEVDLALKRRAFGLGNALVIHTDKIHHAAGISAAPTSQLLSWGGGRQESLKSIGMRNRRYLQTKLSQRPRWEIDDIPQYVRMTAYRLRGRASLGARWMIHKTGLHR